jgi:hypothetical protein
MAGERLSEEELTPQQLEIADDFIELCGLEDVADAEIIMYGQSGSVRFGLGRCAEYMMEMRPEDIRAMVLAQIEASQRVN